MEELKSLLRYAYQTKNPLTFPISGPGSVGMEYCFVNLVEPRRQGDRLPQRRVRRAHDRERRALRRHGGRRRSRVGPARSTRRSSKTRSKANRDAQARRVRARRDVDRRAVRREDAGRDRAQVRRAHHRRRRDVARRLAGARRRVGHRRGLFREPEMPVVHAGPVAGVVQRARRRLRQGAQGQDPLAGSWT